MSRSCGNSSPTTRSAVYAEGFASSTAESPDAAAVDQISRPVHVPAMLIHAARRPRVSVCRIMSACPAPGSMASSQHVTANAATEEAYAFAIEHPQIVQWMPCYCGCEAMGHGSNLDCYFKAGVVSDRAQFEEHASFCDICVQITLKTKELRAQGRSLAEIRQIVDQTFGGSGAPGTLTAQPPV